MTLSTWLLIGIVFALGFVGNESETPYLPRWKRLLNLLVVMITWPFFLGAHCQVDWDWEK